MLIEDNEDTKRIDYGKLADAILSKLDAKTFASLNTSNKTLPGAINGLSADLANKEPLIPREYVTSNSLQISLSNQQWARMHLLGLVMKNEAAKPTVFTCSAFRMPDSTLKNSNITILSGETPITWVDGRVTIQIGTSGRVALFGSFKDVTVTVG